MEEKVTTATGIRKHLQGDPIIWVVTILLALFSIPLVYSAGAALDARSSSTVEGLLFRHSFLLLVALGATWVCHRVDYIFYSRISRLALIISVPLMLLAFFFGEEINEASRWLKVPFTPFYFQPSDLAKLALVTNLASMLSKRQGSIQTDSQAMTQILFWCGIIWTLIGLSDISSAALLGATCMLILFIGRVPMKYLGMLALVGVMSGSFAYKFGQRGDTANSRLEAFFGNGEVPYHEKQACMAFANGGVTGLGPGKSVGKTFIPHSESDFIFAIIGEEYGFIGAVIVIGLFLILLYRGLLTVARTDRAFGGLLAAGLSLSLVIQALTHMCVVVGLLPTTGLTLPWISWGGTSLVFTGITVGIILSVTRQNLEGSFGSFSSNKNKRNKSRSKETTPA